MILYYNNNVIIMTEFFNEISRLIDVLINMLGIWGPLLGCILIILESIIPILPLSVFITLNFLAFGNFKGFIISWICIIIGCSISYWMFDKGFKNIFEKRLRNNSNVNRFMKIIDNLKFEQLVTILAIPFTPAFAVNIAAGLSKMKYSKYLKALIIGKAFMVYFWGYIGTSLIESLTHPIALIKIIIIIIIAFISSKVINKIVKID